MEIKLLIAIGNTGLDNTTINYLSTLFQGNSEVKFDLLSVVPLSGVTESQRLLSDIGTASSTNPAASKKEKNARIHLRDLKKRLHDAGVKNEQISCETKFSWANVSTTLIQHGQSGLYDAIVLNKRDLSLLEKMIIGSISTDLWLKVHSVPLWMVSGDPVNTSNFLVPVDCSFHTLNAVDHLAFILQGNPKAVIILFHSCALLADEHITPKEDFYNKWGKDWCDQHLRGDADGHYHFHAAEQILIENGILSSNIYWKKNEEGIEPAQVIARERKKHLYSTLVMGRRQYKEKNIFKGVTDRVLANVKNVTLWVVG